MLHCQSSQARQASQEISGRNLFLLRRIDENGFSASVIPSDISPRASAIGGDMAIRREGEVVEVAVLLQVFLRNQVFITVRERNV